MEYRGLLLGARTDIGDDDHDHDGSNDHNKDYGDGDANDGDVNNHDEDHDDENADDRKDASREADSGEDEEPCEDALEKNTYNSADLRKAIHAAAKTQEPENPEEHTAKKEVSWWHNPNKAPLRRWMGIPSPVEFELSGQLDVATDVRTSLRRRDSNVAPKGVRKK
jgi:hypothetical protein